MRSCVLIVLSFGLVTAGLWLAIPASAASPTRVSFDVDSTVLSRRTTAACGFPVYLHQSGTFVVTLFKDATGSTVRELDSTRGARIAWEAPTKGTSFAYPNNARAHYDYPQGASLGAPATLIVTGQFDKVPGYSADAGRFVFAGEVIDITPEGLPVVDTDPLPSGHNSIPNRCAVLAGP